MLNRVLLIRDRHGIEIDVSLGAMPFEEHAIRRASEFPLSSGHQLLTCSATDLIVLKAFAARDQDWIDIRGIITRSAGEIDWDTVFAELTPLVELKEEPKIIDRLLSLRTSGR